MGIDDLSCQLREPVCWCPTLELIKVRAWCAQSLTLAFYFYLIKMLELAGIPEIILFYKRRKLGSREELNLFRITKWIDGRGQFRNQASCLLVSCSLYHPTVSLPGQFPSFLYFLAASPLHIILHSPLCWGVCLPFLDVLILMVKINLNGTEKVDVNSVLSLPLN